MRTRKSGRRLKTTLTSFEVVDALAELGGARVTEVADFLDISKSVAYNHLKTLQEAGYVTMQGDEYRLGLKFTYIGTKARLGDEAYKLAITTTREMDEETRFDTDFVIEENGLCRYLETHWNDRMNAEIHPVVGQELYLHTNAAGKAILASYSEDVVDKVVDRWGLPSQTEETITSREELKAELEDTRERGYGTNQGELQDGVQAVGMSIYRPNGTVLGAMSISTQQHRTEEDVFTDNAINVLRNYVHKLEDRLNSSGSIDPI